MIDRSWDEPECKQHYTLAFHGIQQLIVTIYQTMQVVRDSSPEIARYHIHKLCQSFLQPGSYCGYTCMN